jgi:hypothetical protein
MTAADYLLLAFGVVATWAALLYLVWRFYRPVEPMEVAQEFARWRHRKNLPLATFDQFADQEERQLAATSKAAVAWSITAVALCALLGVTAAWLGIGS